MSNRISVLIPFTVLYEMARQLTTQNIFQLIVNGVTGNMEIVLQRVEMA